MASRLDHAIAAGVEYLGGCLGQQMVWRDFAVPGVTAGSTECITAFIAAQLGPIPEGRALAARAITAVATRPRTGGGWGYREDVPADCDSTAWVLLAASAAGVRLHEQLAARAAAFLISHQDSSGGFATYNQTARTLLTPADQLAWFEPEVSVTSSAVMALVETGRADPGRLRAARDFLTRQCAGGLWASYWWAGFGYATHLALSALSRVDGTTPAELTRAEQALISRHRPSGGWANDDDAIDNAFSTAFALRTLLLTGADLAEHDAIVHSLAWLSGLHAPADAEMLAPGAAAGDDLLLRDSGPVTTAAVVRALHEARTRLAYAAPVAR
ncbi:prenyltransferase/squalene oxidase repeat-containing protein [Streptomyces sp. NPDC020800]|uniref:prenyltransferase/squalene oxidase repeat-containing protein n=1 Tax=Streptomyces sp. NPDC020800 TaxID=3365092 RepID=UPI0037A4F047